MTRLIPLLILFGTLIPGGSYAQSGAQHASLAPLSAEDSVFRDGAAGCYRAAYTWPDSVARFDTRWHMPKPPQRIRLTARRARESERPMFIVAGRITSWEQLARWGRAPGDSLWIASAGPLSGYRLRLARDSTGFHGRITFVLDVGPIIHEGQAVLTRVQCHRGPT